MSLLMTVCLKKREVNGERIYFLKDKKEPYTGKSVILYDSGNKWVVNYSKGKMDGLSDYSYPNGAKAYIDFYENGKMVRHAKSWKPDGSICDVTNVVDGEGVAQTYIRRVLLNGEQISKMVYIMAWKLGFMRMVREIRKNQNNDKLDGLSTYWYESG